MRLKIYWKRWSEMILKFLAIAGSFASLGGLLIYFRPRSGEIPWWAVVAIAFSIFMFIVFVVLEVLSYRGRHIFATSDRDGIKRYMHNWIQHGGVVAIWTRDMSWADSTDTRQLLIDKARRGELILCLPEKIPFAEELEIAGAEICAYGADCLELPASRFTINFFGRDGAQIAVGRAAGDTHVIDEFAAGEHPAFFLADDLVRLVRAQRAEGRLGE